MAKDIRHTVLGELLPSSIAGDRNVAAAAEGLSPELAGVTEDISQALILSRIDELPEPVVDLLAWQFHVDFYSTGLDVAVKRRLVKSAVAWHRKKGTLWAVKKVLEDLGVKPRISEWFEFGGRPHTFGVEVAYPGNSADAWTFLGPDTEKVLWDAVSAAKPVRSYLLYLVVTPGGEEDEAHWCVYSHCNYSHGYLNNSKIDGGVLEWHGGGYEILDASRNVFRTDMAVNTSTFAYSVSNYSDGYIFMPVVLDDYVRVSAYADRDYIPAAHEWHTRRTWECGGSWARPCDNPILVDYTEYSQSTAVYSYTEYSGVPCISPRFRKVESMGVYSDSAYSMLDIEPPAWTPVYGITFGVTSVAAAADLAAEQPDFGRIDVTEVVVEGARIEAAFDGLWSLPGMNIWHEDKDWQAGTWLKE